MPASARKSSIAGTSRRASQKGYIPYRGDNPEVGKKTGIAVRHVERKSDGFEPFEEVMRQADARTPPRPKAKRRKTQQLPALDEDENGEMSMELDDNNNTPLAYFKNARQQPLSANRVGSSSRPVGRPSLVDYDQIPSPRPLSNRFSVGSTSAGPSHLSKSFAPEDYDDDDDIGGVDFDDQPRFDPDDIGDDNAGSDDLGQPPPNESSNGRRLSFVAINQDADDDEQEEHSFDNPPDPESPPRLNGKGKGRATSEEMDNDDGGMGQDIARGLGDLDNGDASEHEAEEEPRRKVAKTGIKRNKQPTKKVTNDLRRSSTPPGVRRSKRYRFRPLEWWRQERVVYGRRDSSSGPILVPHIKEVITIPKEAPLPLSKQKRGKTSRARSKSKAESPEQSYNPEEGWDDKTPSHARVLDFLTGSEVERRIAYTEKMLDPHTAANADWMFEKVFGDGEFIAAGELLVPPGCRKPSKPTKDNTYVFFVIEGAINLRIHNSSLILASGAMFMVPRGNTYFIENICQRTVRLFFTQARKMSEDDEPPQLQDPPEAVVISNGRSSSAGAVPRKVPHNALKRAASTRI